MGRQRAVNGAEDLADRLIGGLDRHVLGGGEVRRLGAPLQPQQPQQQQQQQQEGQRYGNDADSMLRAWRDAVHAPTEEDFSKLWRIVRQEFPNQGGRFFENLFWAKISAKC